jgi:hypothetical protein
MMPATLPANKYLRPRSVPFDFLGVLAGALESEELLSELLGEEELLEELEGEEVEREGEDELVEGERLDGEREDEVIGVLDVEREDEA